ncbi:MAG: hypothetical protein RL227_506, partial [Pseudomonadota bacterium]
MRKPRLSRRPATVASAASTSRRPSSGSFAGGLAIRSAWAETLSKSAVDTSLGTWLMTHQLPTTMATLVATSSRAAASARLASQALSLMINVGTAPPPREGP